MYRSSILLTEYKPMGHHAEVVNARFMFVSVSSSFTQLKLKMCIIWLGPVLLFRCMFLCFRRPPAVGRLSPHWVPMRHGAQMGRCNRIIRWGRSDPMGPHGDPWNPLWPHTAQWKNKNSWNNYLESSMSCISLHASTIDGII